MKFIIKEVIMYQSVFALFDKKCKLNRLLTWKDKGVKILKKTLIVIYFTPIKYLLWLAETSLHWLWQISMSNSDELKTGNIVYVSADRELKIDWTKSSPCNITFFTVSWQLSIDIATLTDF